ncbi:hypothetical protein HYH03_004187 [Edaphochlamys debaryana]|uniref:Cytochrome P450 n=1 Tax=Edaphochlamys debaryana TaxID=47281 RepID=A0A835Y7X7_9CHLO|nr:hypothetical protein HYH03_004187 [Edaphochlamys debaryana]|eukprot:KAG2497925.1 hypothetical protein HYH03_004187 [Edaphochlamys debaryana]
MVDISAIQAALGDQGVWAAVATLAAGVLLLVLVLSRKQSRLCPLYTELLPVIGDSIELSLSDSATFMFKRYKQYGSVFRVTLAGTPAYVVADYEAIRKPYRDEGGFPETPFSAFKALMGDYNVTGNKAVHGPWRKAFLQALGSGGLQRLFPRVLAVMEGHLAEWERYGGMPSLYASARRMGLDLSIDVVADVELSERVDRVWFKKEAATWLDGIFAIPINLPGTPLAKALAAKQRIVAVLEAEVAAVHDKLRGEWEASGHNLGAVAEARTAAGSMRLSTVTQLGLFGIGHSELRDSAMSVLHSVMAAGDTTRWTLFNTWALLAMSPRVQEECFKEQQKVIAEYGPEMSWQAVSNVPYMDAVLKEAMRLLPASAGGLRKLTEDLAVGDVVVPKGSYVWLYAHMMHCLDPVLWDGRTDYDLPPHMDWRNNFEEAFKPERWLGDAKPKYYFTFGSGTHLCAGQQLAYMEVKTMLSMVLRRYRVRLDNPRMLHTARFFPFTIPAPGTDRVILEPRAVPSAAA